MLGAAIGLCIGSFLNVVIYRLPIGQSIVTPPSRCRKCGYQLQWYDNIPVLSWLFLRGRCRKCGVGVSIQYPIVELITGALFVLVIWMTPPGPLLATRLILVCILIALFGIDLEHQILPNVDHAAGNRDWRAAQPDRAARMEGRADRRAAWRRRSLRDCRGVLPVAA